MPRRALFLVCLFAFGALAAPGAGLRLTVVDEETGAAVPCRIHLKDPSGKPVHPPGLPFWNDHFVCNGVLSLDLAPGDYAYQIDRGPEYRLATGAWSVAEPGLLRTTHRLERLVNLATEGWWSGELHLHRPPGEIELLMRAEDLHVAPVITWWNNQNLWRDRPLPSAALVSFDHNRFYHLLGGEDERAGGALLYFNLDRPMNIAEAQRESPSPMQFLAEARRQPGSWVDIEKPFWYDAPVWLASGMVDSVGIAHNHMHRGGVMANEAWGRARDRQQFPDPQGNGFWTQEIYYHILNCGLRLPPSAGSASGVLPNPVGYNRLYVRLDGAPTYEKWWEGFKAGCVFVSNGPLLRCRAAGEWPGHVFQAPAGQAVELPIEADLDSRDAMVSFEIIQNGRVVRSVPCGVRERNRSLGALRFSESGWFLVRALANVPGTFRFASTGPFYVEIGPGTRRVSRTSARFFLDWVRERMGRIHLDDPAREVEVLKPHREAERFWQAKLEQATAD